MIFLFLLCDPLACFLQIGITDTIRPFSSLTKNWCIGNVYKSFTYLSECPKLLDTRKFPVRDHCFCTNWLFMEYTVRPDFSKKCWICNVCFVSYMAYRFRSGSRNLGTICVGVPNIDRYIWCYSNVWIVISPGLEYQPWSIPFCRAAELLVSILPCRQWLEGRPVAWYFSLVS